MKLQSKFHAIAHTWSLAARSKYEKWMPEWQPLAQDAQVESEWRVGLSMRAVFPSEPTTRMRAFIFRPSKQSVTARLKARQFVLPSSVGPLGGFRASLRSYFFVPFIR